MRKVIRSRDLKTDKRPFKASAVVINLLDIGGPVEVWLGRG